MQLIFLVASIRRFASAKNGKSREAFLHVDQSHGMLAELAICVINA